MYFEEKHKILVKTFINTSEYLNFTDTKFRKRESETEFVDIICLHSSCNCKNRPADKEVKSLLREIIKKKVKIN